MARLYGIDAKTVRAIDNELLQETTRTADFSQTRKLLVDEKRIAKRRFATIVLDDDSHKSQQIEPIAMDGSYAYRQAVEQELPGTKICLDRFHLYRDINQMVRCAYQEMSHSPEVKVQRQIIRRVATLTSRDDQQAPALLAELCASHHLNAELIA